MEIRLLYVIFQGINKAGGGIAKKINSQIKAFQNLGINTSTSFLEVDGENKYTGRTIDGEILEEYSRISGMYISWKWRYKFRKLFMYIIEKKINVVYIRYTHFANPFFIRFLKKLKKAGVIVVMEIPSFPYDGEYNRVKFQAKIIKHIEEFYRHYFFGCVDRIVTFSDATEIFGVKTVKINNGIDLDTIQLKKISVSGNSIHLIAVAVINIWHGYDRIIEGLKTYYNNPGAEVFLHIIGDSGNEESNKYKSLVKEYDLGKYVSFYGFKSGDELDALFNIADLAIGSVGIHRIGLSNTNPIKFGEYCARGIPFVYSGIYDIFEEQPFIYKVPNDDSAVNIHELVNFVKTNKFYPEEIRKFAAENLTWEIQMAKILNEIEILKNEQGI